MLPQSTASVPPPHSHAPWLPSAALGIVAALLAALGCRQIATVPAWNAALLETAALTAPMPWSTSEGLPDRTVIQAGQLVIHADFPLAGQHRLIRDLETLRADVSQQPLPL